MPALTNPDTPAADAPDYDGLLALLAKATPTDWRVGPSHVLRCETTLQDGRRKTTWIAEACTATDISEAQRVDNFALIAALHNAAPALIAASRENARLRQALADLANQINIVGSNYHTAMTALDAIVTDVKKQVRAALAAPALQEQPDD